MKTIRGEINDVIHGDGESSVVWPEVRVCDNPAESKVYEPIHNSWLAIGERVTDVRSERRMDYKWGQTCLLKNKVHKKMFTIVIFNKQ